MPCICGAATPTESCCGALIAGRRQAETAEQLMRSRYAAYVLEAIDYLAMTQDPRTAKSFDRQAAASWAESAEWQGLEIVAIERGSAADKHGVVEFKARYAIDGETTTHHERSTFRQDGGRWFYVSGQSPSAGGKRTTKVGRNEKCPCGSGKKYKRCCGAAR